jgi:hypothetical protein
MSGTGKRREGGWYDPFMIPRKIVVEPKFGVPMCNNFLPLCPYEFSAIIQLTDQSYKILAVPERFGLCQARNRM